MVRYFRKLWHRLHGHLEVTCFLVDDRHFISKLPQGGWIDGGFGKLIGVWALDIFNSDKNPGYLMFDLADGRTLAVDSVAIESITITGA